ncbi:sodium:solute symporter family protein [uncultured Candidatus Kuenenia sp.]|jgi:Na+/proline symporter|uniref:sodium:solute symporter family protein n=1 Tax=uncultured Candidatus Kuenenia sp. TaxID=1048336 RepID=UPI0002EE1414|nr:sodium:solute symporter family protein [uncultured Candidatus Kuenenia sp.]TVL96196.1 MAG: sodium:proline symporter [Candidatus Kuenenia stuttgartiensis]
MFERLHYIDVSIILAYLFFTFLIGVYFSRRASKNMDEFFVSGRCLPWWIVGTSMVATTFAADTPLAVSGLVAKGGIWKNWIWWNWGVGGIFAVFLFARLWNRAGITTDAELVELRYDGMAAACLRIYRAVWFGLFQNVLIIAWVMKAMSKIIVTIMGWDQTTIILGLNAEVFAVLVLFLITVVYTTMSGLWGVVATDVVQFIIAMTGSIYLAVASVIKLGGMAEIQRKLAEGHFDVDSVLRIIPKVTPLNHTTPFTEFLALVLIVWVVMYNVDGGGYIAQRLFAAKNERHSMFAYLWFNTAMICLRPWPWIIVGLCGMAYFGKIDDVETYYPLMMKETLPVGMFGVMIAAFFAAFMSTIDTQLNWGASIIVNDCYKRFFRKTSGDKEYVLIARIVIVCLAFLGTFFSFAVKDISQVWIIVFSVTAGIGSVYILRWYWWRVNAWSEISAFSLALAGTFVFKGIPFSNRLSFLKDTLWGKGLSGFYPEQPLFQFPYSIAVSMVVIIPAWIAITFITRPVSQNHLIAFYKKVYPGGPGWKSIAQKVPGYEDQGIKPVTFLHILLGIIVVNCILIGTGKVILGAEVSGIILLLVAICSGSALFFFLKKQEKRLR